MLYACYQALSCRTAGAKQCTSLLKQAVPTFIDRICGHWPANITDFNSAQQQDIGYRPSHDIQPQVHKIDERK